MAKFEEEKQKTSKIEESEERPTFVKEFVEQLKETGRSYKAIAKHPLLIPKGCYETLKDTFYELPRSLLRSDEGKTDQQKLDEKLSQALSISEVIGVPGTYAGIFAAKLLGADDYTAGLVGGTLGNYVTAAGSFIATYLTLSRKVEGYSKKQAIKDSLKMVRNVLPVAAAVYATQGPAYSLEIALGLSPNAAATINYGLFSGIFTGTAKQVSKQEIIVENKENKASVDKEKTE